MPPNYNQFYHYNGEGAGLRYPREYRMKWTVDWHAWPRTIQGCEEMTGFQNVLRHYDPFQAPRTAESIREKLAEILWWGYQGNEKKRIDRFLNACPADNPRLVQFGERISEALSKLQEFNAAIVCAQTLFNLEIPQFSKMSFGSKLLMFAAPKYLVVMDGKVYEKLQRLARDQHRANQLVEMLGVDGLETAGLLGCFDRLPDAMGDAMSQDNREQLINAYAHWCLLCQEVARFWRNHGQDERWQASDVERVFFSRLARG